MADYSSLSVEDLVQELQQKDDAVRMAAEFGQQILAQLQEAQQKHNALASENEDLKIRVWRPLSSLLSRPHDVARSRD